MAKAPALDVVNTAENSATEFDSKVATFDSKPYNVDISDDDDDIHEFIRRLAENLDENFGGQAFSVGPLCQDLGALLLGAADDRKRARVEYRPPPSRYAAAAETKAQRAGATDATERQYREAIRGNHKVREETKLSVADCDTHRREADDSDKKKTRVISCRHSSDGRRRRGGERCSLRPPPPSTGVSGCVPLLHGAK